MALNYGIFPIHVEFYGQNLAVNNVSELVEHSIICTSAPKPDYGRTEREYITWAFWQYNVPLVPNPNVLASDWRREAPELRLGLSASTENEISTHKCARNTLITNRKRCL